MSYERLADDLAKTAERLRNHGDDLDGAALAKAAGRLDAALGRFEERLAAALKGVHPDVLVLKQLLASDDARRGLDPKALRAIAREASGRSLALKKDDSPGQQRQRLLDAAIKHGCARETTEAVRSFLAAAARPLPDPKDRDALLKDVWRLASLSKPKLAIEEQRLLANEGVLRAMAEVAYVRAGSRVAPRGLFRKLVAFSRRVKDNVS